MREKIKDWIKNEYIVGWSKFDYSFVFSMLALQIITAIIDKSDVLSIVCGIAGCISVVLTSKGKISFYYIGFVQTITYTVLAFNQRFYGEVLENIFYLVTMIIGIFLWKKGITKTKDEGHTLMVKKFTIKMWALSILATTVLTLALGFALTKINSQQAYTDAATNIFAIFGQLLMIRRYREQWVWWMLVNLFCLKLWFVAGNWSMFAMYIAWTINCVYGWVNWTKLNKSQGEKK